MRIILLITLLLLSFLATAATSANNNQQIITISNLTGKKQITLQGTNPKASLFLPIPKNWELTAINVHLVVKPSPVLNNQSTLTASINNKELSAVSLASANGGKMINWNFSIPKEDVVNTDQFLTINGYLKISNDPCSDLLNPAAWAELDNSSSITYEFTPKIIPLNLQQFPFSYLKSDSLVSDKINLLLPAEPSMNILATTFELSRYLSSVASWRGLTLNTYFLNQNLANNNSDNNNFIMVGTYEQLHLQAINTKWPLPLSTAGTFTDSNGQALPATTGVIMLISPPWNPTGSLLILTGQTEEAVNNAVSALYQPLFSKLAQPTNYLLIPNQSNFKPQSIDFNHFTLKDEGYNDKFVYAGDNTITNYVINLPTNVTPEELDLSLNLGFSSGEPSFSKKASTVELSINEKPFSTFDLKEVGNKIEWQVTIPQSYLQPGENYIGVKFNLLPPANQCNNDFLAKSWGAIYANSLMSVSFSSESVVPNLKKVMDLFVDGGVIVLPKTELSSNEFSSIFKFATNLKMSYQPFIFVHDLPDVSSLKDKDIILIGAFNDNTFIQTALNHSPFVIQNKQLSIKDISTKFDVRYSQSFGLIHIMNSPWNSQHFLLIITGTDNAAVERALNVLANEKLDQDSSIVYENGTYINFSINSTSSIKGILSNIFYWIRGHLH